MYCRFRLPVSTNKRSGCAEAGRVAYIIRSCSSPWVTMSHVMVTQQGSVFGDAAGTRRHGQALNALAVTQSQWRPKGPFLRRSCQDIHFKEGPGFFRRLFPLVTCLPSQGCVAQLAFQAGVRSCPFPVTALPNRGSCSKPGPRAFDVENRWRLSAGPSGGCSEMGGTPGGPPGTGQGAPEG